MKSLVAARAVLIAGACTTAMNWRFSFQLGASAFDSYTWAIFSVALDVAKWFMLPCAALAWTAHRLRALAAIAIWSVATVYSFTAAVGFAALNRDMTSAARIAHAEVHKRLEIMRQSPRWLSTAACAVATSPQSREFCATYRALDAQAGPATHDSDPQSTLFAQLTGFAPETMRLVLVLFLATACEVISALGLFALMPPERTSAKPKTNPWTPPTRRDTGAAGRAVVRLAAPEHDTPRPTRTWKSPR